MTLSPEQEELMEAIDRSFGRMRPREIVDFLTNEDVRRKFTIRICEDFEIPDTGKYGVEDFYDLLRIVRLKEDSYGSALKPEMRKKIVQYCFDAICETDRISPVDAAPAQTDTVAPVSASDESVETMDIRREIKEAPAQPERFAGHAPDMILFPSETVTSRDVPVEYPRLLTPPPPEGSDDSLFLTWISGMPVRNTEFAFGLDELGDAAYAKMINLEAEYNSSPKSFMNNAGHKVCLQFEPASHHTIDPADALEKMQADIGETSDPDLLILKAFRDAVARTLQEVWPENAKVLSAHGAVLRTGSELMGHIRQAWSIEAGWLDECGGRLEGHQQNIIGTPHPDGEMSAGLLFRRAAFLHLSIGESMPSALLDAALDLRLAMAVRGLDMDEVPGVVQDFDKKTIANCARPLSSYRIAKKEIEPAI
jgi:hypothetical protein